MNKDPDEISEDLISELRAIAEGNFELGGELHQVSSDMSRQKSNKLNLLSLGALTVKDYDPAALDAQSNIATEAANVSHKDASMIVHSEMGEKICLSNTRAVANKLASGAYGSELEYSNSHYHQAGAYPLRKMVDEGTDEDYDDEEDFEEEFEEELESDLNEEMED